jgi:hypothetical protein
MLHNLRVLYVEFGAHASTPHVALAATAAGVIVAVAGLYDLMNEGPNQWTATNFEVGAFSSSCVRDDIATAFWVGSFVL